MSNNFDELYSLKENGNIQCNLCFHSCSLPYAHRGVCGIRKADKNKIVLTNDMQILPLSIDPIEKKPLYHFKPNSKILSIGTIGCNMSCPFCQNYSISQYSENINYNLINISEAELVSTAKNNKISAIAFTYNEPLIWYESVYKIAKNNKLNNIKNVLVTNATIKSKPLLSLLPFIDAANIDLKAFNKSFYSWCKGDLETVKDNIQLFFNNNVHIEISFLLIPNKNDNEEDFVNMLSFISSISKDIPLHINRYFPNYKVTEAATPEELLIKFANIAKKYLNYVYIGNSDIDGWNDTKCTNCGNTIIKRDRYNIEILNKGETCNKCKNCLPILY